MERKPLLSSRFITASVLFGTLFATLFGNSGAGALTVPSIKFDNSSLKLPPAFFGQPYDWVIKGTRIASTPTAGYECVPKKFNIGTIQLTKNCHITGIVNLVSKQFANNVIKFEMKDLTTNHIIKSGNVKFSVEVPTNSPAHPVPTPTTSGVANPDPAKTHLSDPMPQPNPQPIHSGAIYWPLGTWESAAPVPLTIEVGPFAVGPVSCTMSGVVSVTLVLKIIDNSIPGDIKGLAPATSSDFKVVKIKNDCGQAALAGNVFRTATDHLVGNIDFTDLGSQFLMSLNAAGISSALGKFDLQGNSLTGSFNIPTLADANGTNISITSNNFTYSFTS